jgi:hypothetical protein
VIGRPDREDRGSALAGGEDAPSAAEAEYSVDIVPDELALARSQMASGLAGIAEAVLTRRIAQLQAQGPAAFDELDAARALLAEALWRQGRAIAAGGVADRIRAGSLERRRPLVMIIEAEALAATGQREAAERLMERTVAEIGVDEAWRLRGGIASRLPWPQPASFRPRPAAEVSAARRARDELVPPSSDPARTAGAHARLEAAREAYANGDHERGDRELMVGLRQDSRIAPEGVALIEPTLTGEPATERLLLYGDLLRASGRPSEASAVYDRAAKA